MVNNRGLAFFISLTLLLLLSMGITVFLLTSYNSANINEALVRRSKAITIAEAGINYAYWKIRINEDDDGDPMSDSFPGTCTLTPPISVPTGWSVDVAVEDTGSSPKTIRSRVVYPKASVF